MTVRVPVCAELRALFAAVDTDHSGGIHIDELVEMVWGNTETETETETEAGAGAEAEAGAETGETETETETKAREESQMEQ